MSQVPSSQQGGRAWERQRITFPHLLGELRVSEVLSRPSCPVTGTSVCTRARATSLFQRTVLPWPWTGLRKASKHTWNLDTPWGKSMLTCRRVWGDPLCNRYLPHLLQSSIQPTTGWSWPHCHPRPHFAGCPQVRRPMSERQRHCQQAKQQLPALAPAHSFSTDEQPPRHPDTQSVGLPSAWRQLSFS